MVSDRRRSRTCRKARCEETFGRCDGSRPLGDYLCFPGDLQDAFGFDLYLVQAGQHPPSAKILNGLGGGVLELATRFDGDAYRAVYTVRFSGVVYVLHCFKKKSKRGIKTPKTEIDLIPSSPSRG